MTIASKYADLRWTKQRESTVLFWWGINEGLGADTAASHKHFVRHTVFTPRLFRNYNRNTVQGRQRAHALTRLCFTTARQRGAAWAPHCPHTKRCGTRWTPTRAELLSGHPQDCEGSGDGKGPCMPLPRGHLKCIPASQTTAMTESERKARIWSLGKKNILLSEQEGYEHLCNCFVTRALVLCATAAESRAHKEFVGCTTAFLCVKQPPRKQLPRSISRDSRSLKWCSNPHWVNSVYLYFCSYLVAFLWCPHPEQDGMPFMYET